MENMLGDIETDCDKLTRTLPLSGAQHLHFCTSMPSAGRPPHHKPAGRQEDCVHFGLLAIRLVRGGICREGPGSDMQRQLPVMTSAFHGTEAEAVRL